MGFTKKLHESKSPTLLTQVGQQERRVHITLDRIYAAGTVMPALRQRFFDRGLIAVTVLRKSGVGGNNFEQYAPIFATMRVKRATNIPGAHSATLLP